MLLSGQIPPIAQLIATAIVLLIAMTVHEFAHAYVANLMGDSTAKDMGKMTLDPRVNINPIGFLMFLFIGFGILGQVVVNERRMRNPRWGMFFAVAAGPFSNLLLAAIGAIPFWLGWAHIEYAQQNDIVPTLNMILTLFVSFNVLLFLFNLIPLAPLDGWTIVGKLLPPDVGYTWYRYQRESSYVLFGWIILSYFMSSAPPPINSLTLEAIIGPPQIALLRFFFHV